MGYTVNDRTKNSLAKLCEAVTSSTQGDPIMVFWIGGDGVARGCFFPRDGDGKGRGIEPLESIAALSEIISGAADAAIKQIARSSDWSEESLRLAYLSMRDNARAKGYNIYEEWT